MDPPHPPKKFLQKFGVFEFTQSMDMEGGEVPAIAWTDESNFRDNRRNFVIKKFTEGPYGRFTILLRCKFHIFNEGILYSKNFPVSSSYLQLITRIEIQVFRTCALNRPVFKRTSLNPCFFCKIGRVVGYASNTTLASNGEINLINEKAFNVYHQNSG